MPPALTLTTSPPVLSNGATRSPPLQPLPLSPAPLPFSPSPPTQPRTTRPSPPQLVLGAVTSNTIPIVEMKQKGASAGSHPSLTIQPASPAMPSSGIFASPTSPFPPPVPSTSSASTTVPTPSFQPPSPGGGSTLAARRAAKLGKKRLSLVVPTSAASAGGGILSPASPAYLRPGGADDDAETRSLPPSPVNLTTFIGTEGAEAPDRTIGRLMLKQQADEMREQMRGGRGMKRRTSIPRLNLVAGGGAGAKPANLDNLVASSSLGGAGGRGNEGLSVVQLIRGDAVERRGENGDLADDVEEFPYALGPREILPGIFLGSEQNAKDPKVLREWRIGFVLNVAKEVECPWTDETIEELDEEDTTDEEQLQSSSQMASSSSSTAPIPLRPKHRRTKTQAAIATQGTSDPAPTALPVRPPFIRPTASTPNLHAIYNPLSPPPPVPAIPSVHLAGAAAVHATSPLSSQITEAMQRSLSSSPPVPRRTPPRGPLRRTISGSSTSTRSPGAIRIPPNARTARPPLEYLWLKWGHDESDLVEARKFQAAFNFLDEARERGERVLVHCQCGVSRSATVVIAYCMREAAKAIEEGRDAQELAGCTGMHDTYSFVKEKSEWVGPNLSLVFQLVAYERTLRGDSPEGGENGEEPAYPHYPPEPPSHDEPSLLLPNGTSHSYDDDLPPPTPSGFGSFSFPTTLQLQIQSRNDSFPPLRSPRTPITSEGSVSGSQLSTPDLHDTSTSPTFSNGTSSVTSTPLSEAEKNALPHPPVRVVEADEHLTGTGGAGARGRHSSMETIVGGEDVRGGEETSKQPFFVLPSPPARYRPNGAIPSSSLEAISPTVAFHFRSRPAPPTLSLSLPGSPAFPLSTSSSSSTLSSASSRGTVTAAASGAGRTLTPPEQALSSSTSTSTASPPGSSPQSASTTKSSTSASSPYPSLPSSLSSSSLSSSSVSPSFSTNPGTSSLSRQNSAARRFGTNQTASQRRASHRRVFSLEGPFPLPVAAAAAAPAQAHGVGGGGSGENREE